MSEGNLVQLLSNQIYPSSYSFQEWRTLDDKIMGGSSNSICKATSEGLLFYGNAIELGGGFVSCCSEIFNPSLNLNEYRGIELNIDGFGKDLKIALSCNFKPLGIKGLNPRGLRWIDTFPTNISGTTDVKIYFNSLEPHIRAKKIMFPAKFNSRSIIRLQLLYSKFAKSGKINDTFSSGEFKLLLRSVNVIK